MTISIQTQKRKFGREWLGNNDQKARQGQFRFSFLLSFSPSMQFHSCDTDKFCISETAGVLQWRAGPSKEYSYTKHHVKLNPLYSLSRLNKKKKKSSRKVSRSGSPTEMVELRHRCQGQRSVEVSASSLFNTTHQHIAALPYLVCSRCVFWVLQCRQGATKKKKGDTGSQRHKQPVWAQKSVIAKIGAETLRFIVLFLKLTL